MLIKGDAHNEKRRKRRRVASSGTVDRSTGGVEYAIIDPRQGSAMHTVTELDGDTVRLVNRTGFTRDVEIAAAARAKGLHVVPRDVAVAGTRTFFTFSDTDNWDKINWHRDGDGAV